MCSLEDLLGEAGSADEIVADDAFKQETDNESMNDYLLPEVDVDGYVEGEMTEQHQQQMYVEPKHEEPDEEHPFDPDAEPLPSMDPGDWPDQSLQDSLALFELLHNMCSPDRSSDAAVNAKAEQEQRVLGTVEKFVSQRGFGLIIPSDGTDGARVFAHWTQIKSDDAWPALTPGMRVEYTLTQDDGKLVAVCITAPGGGNIVTVEQLAKAVRVLSKLAVTGKCKVFHFDGCGVLISDAPIAAPDGEVLPAGSEVSVSREELLVDEGSVCKLQPGMDVQFRVYRAPDGQLAAAEVTGLGGVPLVCEVSPVGPPALAKGAGKGKAKGPGLIASSASGVQKLIQKPTAESRSLPRVRKYFGEQAAKTILAAAPETPQHRLEGSATPMCKFYLEGRCAKGASCSFSHGQEQDTLTEDLLNAVLDAKAKLLPSWGTTNQASALPALPRTAERCKYFAENRCIKGSACPFLHEAAAEVAPAAKIPCRFFLENRCARGASCPFSHNLLDALGSPSETKSWTAVVPCKFHQQGKCTRGAGCPFAHE